MQFSSYLVGIFSGIFFWVMTGNVNAQTYQPADENTFLNTRWKFTYASHIASDEVVFRAEDGYDHFVWFKYDDTCHTYFNGNLTAENWQLNIQGTILQYHFSNIKEWQVAEYNSNILALAFTMGETGQAYRYHFIRATDEETPFFVYHAHELPEAQVTKVVKGKDPHPYRYLKDEPGKRFRKPAKVGKNKKEPEIKEQPEFMQIELVGGGFSGGPDPTYRNHLVIKTDGRIIREIQTEKTGLRVWKSNISRKHLEELMLYFEKKNFFEMEQIYACSTQGCMERMRETPRPIALRLAITKGASRKVVTVSIFEGLGKKSHWVNYPPELDMIIKAIEDVTMMALTY